MSSKHSGRKANASGTGAPSAHAPQRSSSSRVGERLDFNTPPSNTRTGSHGRNSNASLSSASTNEARRPANARDSETPVSGTAFLPASGKSEGTMDTFSAFSTNSRGNSSTSPPNVLVNSMPSSNSPPPPSSAASHRNALGAIPGWGVALAHSGSYLSTHVRTSSTIPLLAEETSTFNAIKSMLHDKILSEVSSAKKSKARLLAKSLKAKEEKNAALRKESRERAESEVKWGREQLDKLISQRSELEKTVRSEWEEKIDKFKQHSLQEEQEELKKLEEEHERELEKITEEARLQNERDEEKLAEYINGNINSKGKKRKAKTAALTNESEAQTSLPEGRSNTASNFKRTRISDKESKKSGGTMAGSEDGSITKTKDGATDKVKSDHTTADSDGEGDIFGDDDDDSETGDVLRSVKKKEELKKLVAEVNDLNRTKSQMIWLLKQVITAEKKRSERNQRKKIDSEFKHKR